MATMSEMLVGSVLESSQKAPDISGAMVQGAQIAQHVEQVKQQRAQLEKDKEALKVTKMKEMSDDILKSKDMSGKQKSGFVTYLNAKAKSYGIDDVFSPSSIDLVTSAPQNMDRFQTLVNDVETGTMPYSSAVKMLNDQSSFYDVTPAMTSDLAAAGKTAALEANKMARTQVMADSTANNQQKARDQAGQVELIKQVNQDYAEYEKVGGEQLDANLRLLKDVRAALVAGKIRTGGAVTFIPTDTLKKWAIPDLVSAGNAAKKAIQGSLKATLGAQFTKEEGERVENRTWDGQLDTKYNIKTLDEEILKIENSRLRAEAMFTKYVPDFKLRANKEVATSIPQIDIGGKLIPVDVLVAESAKNPKVIPDLAKRLNKSEAEVKKMLGIK